MVLFSSRLDGWTCQHLKLGEPGTIRKKIGHGLFTTADEQFLELQVR